MAREIPEAASSAVPSLEWILDMLGNKDAMAR